MRFKALICLVVLGVIRVNLGCYQGNGVYTHINMCDILTNRVRALKSTLGIALLFVCHVPRQFLWAALSVDYTIRNQGSGSVFEASGQG